MRVAIVGGGLAGLAAAYDLAAGDVTITVLEETPALGGQIRTRREHGFVVDDGAEGFMAADRDVPELCRALGIGDQIVGQIERQSLLFRKGKLAPLSAREAAALLGLQATEEALGQGIVSLRDGMGVLTDALIAALADRATITTRRSVESLTRNGKGWKLKTGNGPEVEADAVILASSPAAAADLVAPVAPEAVADLRSVNLISNLSVSLAYPRPAVSHALDASGMVVAPDEDLEGLRACTFSSSKFPNRAPSGSVLLRAFFRPEGAGIAGSDRVWEERAARALQRVLEIRGEPEYAWTAGWPQALPMYGRDHVKKMEGVSERLRRVGPIELAGSAYHPGGVPGAVRSGRLAAQRILSSQE
ncbi:MAG: FAD-dependent oxidoreductase [Gemmatimonadetes bacterium]|nr:FAD-dependent oxidoreductase [Gemmatimonadota bacterium]